MRMQQQLSEADLQKVFGGSSPDTGSTTGLQSQPEGDSCGDKPSGCSHFSLIIRAS